MSDKLKLVSKLWDVKDAVDKLEAGVKVEDPEKNGYLPLLADYRKAKDSLREREGISSEEYQRLGRYEVLMDRRVSKYLGK